MTISQIVVIITVVYRIAIVVGNTHRMYQEKKAAEEKEGGECSRQDGEQIRRIDRDKVRRDRKSR